MAQLETVSVALPATPYRGIHSFLYSDHPIFFARATETRTLLRHIVVYRGVFLYGESGAGKSSLVNAGLIPAAAQEGLRVDRIRVQPRVGEELVVERIPVSGEPGSDFLPSSFADAHERSPRIVIPAEAFADRLREVPEGVRPLLVFDQFEELVTLFEEAREGAALAEVNASRAAQAGVVALLEELLRDDTLAVKLLFIFREDYLAKLRKLLAARPELMDQSLRLTPPSASALGEIVRGPFEAYPGHFEHEFSPELSERLIAAIEERAGSGEINPTEVQVVCLRLWSADDQEGLFEAEGVGGLLEDYLQTALDAFPVELKFPAIALLSQMVTPSGARNVVSADDLVGRVEAAEGIERSVLERALAELEDKTRLVRRERRRDLYLYEITSEFLVPWIRARQGELVRERERAELLEAETQRAREWKNRAFRLSALVLLVVVGVLVAATVVAVRERREAVQQRQDAVRSAHLARSQQLANLASTQVGIDPIRALRTAALAMDEWPTLEAAGALQSALATSPVRAALLRDRRPQDVAFSSNGKLVATAGYDGRARIWDAATGRLLAALPSGAKHLLRVAFSRDDTRLVAAAAGGSARVWDVGSGKLVASLQPSRQYSVGSDDFVTIWVPFPSVEFSRDGSLVLALAPDGAARLWDVETERELLVVRGEDDTVVDSASFSPDGTRVLTASDDGKVKIWSPERASPVRTFEVDDEPARAAFALDGSRVLAVEGHSGTVRVWDLAPGHAPTSLSPGALDDFTDQFVISTTFSANGLYAFTVVPDGQSRLWDVAARTHVVLGDAGQVVNAAFSPDSTLLVTTRSDGTAHLWDARTGARVAVLRNLSGRKRLEKESRLYAASFSPDSGRIIVTSADGATVFAVTRSVGRLRRIRGAERGVTSADITPGGGSLVAVSGGRAVPHPLTGSRPAVGRRLGRQRVDHAWLSPDGSFAVTEGKEGARIWDPSTGRSVTLLGKGVGAVAFSRDGTRVLVGRSQGGSAVAFVGSPRGHKPLMLEWNTTATSVDAASFSADGRLIAVAGSDGITAVFRADDRKQIGALRGYTGRIESVRFNADATRVITGDRSGTAVVWTTNGRIVRVLRGHSKPVLAAAFSPDQSGRLVLTTSADGTARVWDMRTGSTCAVLGDVMTPIRDAEFDGVDRIVAVDGASVVRTEAVPTLCTQTVAELRRDARRVTRPLTSGERKDLLRSP